MGFFFTTLLLLLDLFILFQECFVYMYECEPPACLVSRKVRRGHWVSETGVTDGCELPRGHQESSPGPLQEQQEPLTGEPAL